MHKTLAHWKTLLFLGAAVGLASGGVAAFVLHSNTTAASTTDWPPLTMTYQTKYVVNGSTYNETRKLTYNSKDSWEEKVITADPFTVRQGVFSPVGSYRKLENGQFTTYHALSDARVVEEAERDSLTIPRDWLFANPIEGQEDFLGHELTPVTTRTRVCFENVCTDNAPGWEFRCKDVVVLYADDARGIPVNVGDGFLEIIEVRVQGTKQEVR